MHKQKVPRGNKNLSCELLTVHRKTRLAVTDNSDLIQLFFISLNSPVSLACYLMYKYGENDQLVEKEINPLDYNDKFSFRDDFAAVSLLRKNAFLRTSYNKKLTALDAFNDAEEKCKDVNRRYRENLSSPFLIGDDHATLKRIRSKIRQILGDFDIDLVLDLASWGPGATRLVKGEETSSSHKFDFECQMTLEAYDLFMPVMKAAYPNWSMLNYVTDIPGNKIVTVPKNAKTDRTIAIEPGLNTWIQLGIGRLIRKRLRSAGFDLNSDAKNQRSAYTGSIDGKLATIDFKAASDTISYELVKNLLPDKWFAVLDAARSHYYTLGNETHLSEKFSTMGNGFTFELESLIFATIGTVTCIDTGLDPVSVSIFGDDLIVPVECVEQLTRLCNHMGFTINQKKSFSSGVFRESCGSYYFDGLDVKPYFLKKGLTHIKDLYRFANSVRDLSHRFNQNIGCDERFRHLWKLTCSKVPQSVRMYGPKSSGDATIHCSLNSCKDARNRKDGWEGFTFPGFPTVAVDVERESNGLILSRLHRPSRDMAFGNAVSLRAKTKILFKKRMLVVLWYDFGEWY